MPWFKFVIFGFMLLFVMDTALASHGPMPHEILYYWMSQPEAVAISFLSVIISLGLLIFVDLQGELTRRLVVMVFFMGFFLSVSTTVFFMYPDQISYSY